jgi:DNA-binding NarL/FixJ family response regulator
MFTFKSDRRVVPSQSRSFETPLAPSVFIPHSRRPGSDARVHASCATLTARQRDVLTLLMQGKSNKAICRVLNLAEPTIKNHMSAILKALKVTNRTEAVIKVSGTAVALSFAPKNSGNCTFEAQLSSVKTAEDWS